MRFLDGARVVVVNNIEINTEDGVADILCRMKYNVRLKVFMEKLVANAIFEGEKEGAIDITRLRLVTFKTIKNEM